jgi:hypothetical protein
MAPCLNEEENMLSEPIAVTLLVTEALDKLKIPYLIGGSLASAIYGLARTTMDSDIVADVKFEHATLLDQILKDDFYISINAIQDAVTRRGSFNIIHLKTMFKVDIFVMKSRPFDQMQFQRRVKQIVTNDPPHTIYIASAEDTVLAKLEWFRQGGEVSERQWKDILEVLKIQMGRLDMPYLQYWADDLEVFDLLEKALKEVVS